MTRAEFLDALDAHVETLVDLRTPELRTANATLRTKLERAQADIARLREKLADAEAFRASMRHNSGPVTLAEVLRVVRGYDSARSAGAAGPAQRLHERIARSLLARMEREAGR